MQLVRGDMKRLLIVFCLATFCLGLNAWAEDEDADFSGTWILNAEKSDPAPRMVRDLGANVGGRGMGGSMGGPPMGGMGDMGGSMGGPPMGGMGGMGPMGGRGFGGAMPKIEPVPLVIKQTDDEFQIVSGNIINGQPNLTEEVYKLDGEEKIQELPIEGSEDVIKYATKVELKKDKFKIRSKRSSPQGTNEVKKEYALSKDGQLLTIKTKITNQSGHMVMQTEQKQVYDKQ